MKYFNHSGSVWMNVDDKNGISNIFGQERTKTVSLTSFVSRQNPKIGIKMGVVSRLGK